ncbi:uncharacterized protein LOC129924123 [Biomphalaria glabrata]|uniref:Uncharacterized protein LOC129924123 n=1 Tax=Biomphalaria glabrata TaxID=6526 RepID=A0A9W2ZFT1_BIOGL|nr:uncharacterized protein LOC129924123 [Biomphalaria glabrata]
MMEDGILLMTSSKIKKNELNLFMLLAAIIQGHMILWRLTSLEKVFGPLKITVHVMLQKEEDAGPGVQMHLELLMVFCSMQQFPHLQQLALQLLAQTVMAWMILIIICFRSSKLKRTSAMLQLIPCHSGTVCGTEPPSHLFF